MARPFHLEHLATYRARVQPRWYESAFATDNAVIAKLREAGFSSVDVMYQDGKRYARGTWTGDDCDVDLDELAPQLKDVEKL